MQIIKLLKGKEYEELINALRSKILSCFQLDGRTYITERGLIDQLRTMWNVDDRIVLRQLGLQNFRQILQAYGNMFYMINDFIFLTNPETFKEEAVEEPTNPQDLNEDAQQEAVNPPDEQSSTVEEAPTNPQVEQPQDLNEDAQQETVNSPDEQQLDWEKLEANFAAFLLSEGIPFDN